MRYGREGIVALALALASAPLPAWPAPLTLGLIGHSPSKEFRRFSPLMAHLAKKLKSEGIDSGKIRVTRKIPEMASMMREGAVDIFIDSAFPVLAVRRLAGARLLLRRWKKGVARYRTLIFVRNDSGIRSLADLLRKTIAFDDPFSTSGYLLPKVMFAQEKIPLAPAEQGGARTPSGKVEYVFSRSDENTIYWVLRGKVAAGVTDNIHFSEEAGGRRGELRVLRESFAVPRQLVSVRRGLSPRLVAGIRRVLVGLEHSKAGRRILRKLEKTTRFDSLTRDDLLALEKVDRFVEFELRGSQGPSR